MLPFSARGQARQIGIDTNARTFWFNPHDIPQPLSELPGVLSWVPSPIPARPLHRPKIRTLVGSIFLLLVSLTFVAGGIWQAMAGRTRRDHWIGALAAGFFALCALAPISDLKNWPRRRRNPGVAPPTAGFDDK
jgi:hypothetical protein